MYMIFGGKQYYGAGGANDLIDTLEDMDKSILMADDILGGEIITHTVPLYEGYEDTVITKDIEWVHIYCTDTRKVIFKSKVKPLGDNTDNYDIERVEIKTT